jgi:hypothetical protein
MLTDGVEVQVGVPLSLIPVTLSVPLAAVPFEIAKLAVVEVA